MTVEKFHDNKQPASDLLWLRATDNKIDLQEQEMVEFKDLMPERFSHQTQDEDWSTLKLHQSAYDDRAVPPPTNESNSGRSGTPAKVEAKSDEGGKSVSEKTDGKSAEAKFDADKEASKIIDLARTRLDTIDSITGNATQEGIKAAKALANEVASLTPAQASDVNTSLIAQYQNIYPTWTPVPTGIVNEQGQATGMEIRASKFDPWPGPQSLQILDNGRTVTVRRQTEPATVKDGKELPAVYVVDAQASRN
ncbi:MAG TPA: hypothetical protein V6C86_22515 [Oculatellaceae cyanobacterium]